MAECLLPISEVFDSVPALKKNTCTWKLVFEPQYCLSGPTLLFQRLHCLYWRQATSNDIPGEYYKSSCEGAVSSAIQLYLENVIFLLSLAVCSLWSGNSTNILKLHLCVPPKVLVTEHMTHTSYMGKFSHLPPSFRFVSHLSTHTLSIWN